MKGSYAFCIVGLLEEELRLLEVRFCREQCLHVIFEMTIG